MFLFPINFPKAELGGDAGCNGPGNLRTVTEILRRIVFFCCVAGAVAMLFMMLLTVADVIGRSFFTWPIPGTYELSRYFLVVIVRLGIAHAQQLPPHLQKVFADTVRSE
jgi:TRAP-type C4-dicarboxylate transport system permease small subunit